MNKRIREMAYKTCFESGFEGPEHFVFYHTDLQKFAELIVKECISIVDKYGDSDEGNHIAYQIEKHFGVEE